MHLKRLFIKNFRSIRELDLEFQPGKNVIIGRNNAGKSNIVRALDIVLGESSPDYQNYENITEADFHTTRAKDAADEEQIVTTDKLFIWCELERGDDEELNWEEINRSRGFYFHGNRAQWGTGQPGQPILFELGELRADFEKIFELNDEELPSNAKVWVDSKLNNQTTFKQQFNNKYSFAFAFLARKTEVGITKSLRFLYRESDGEDWGALLQSNGQKRTHPKRDNAIIP